MKNFSLSCTKKCTAYTFILPEQFSLKWKWIIIHHDSRVLLTVWLKGSHLFSLLWTMCLMSKLLSWGRLSFVLLLLEEMVKLTLLNFLETEKGKLDHMKLQRQRGCDCIKRNIAKSQVETSKRTHATYITAIHVDWISQGAIAESDSFPRVWDACQYLVTCNVANLESL